MLASCKQIRIERGSDPAALLAELEATGIEVVESVASLGEYSIVAVRAADWTEEVEREILDVGALHVAEPHPVFGAVAVNHALFARRFPPVEPAPHVAEMVREAQKRGQKRGL